MRRQPAGRTIVAKRAKNVNCGDTVTAIRRIQAAGTPDSKRTRRGRTPVAPKSTPRTKDANKSRDFGALQLTSESRTFWTGHGAHGTDSWMHTSSAESVAGQDTKAEPSRNEDSNYSKLAAAPVDRASPPLTGDGSYGGLPDHAPSQGDPSSAHHQPAASTQLRGVKHSDPSGATIVLKTVDSNAEVIVRRAISFISEVWRPEYIPSVFATKSSVLSTSENNGLEDKAHSNVRIISSGRLIPIARFVEEVLARSRTTGAVLEVALTYLDNLRPRLPHPQRQDLDSPNVRDVGISLSENCDDRSIILACLPSPLLCPRRMFLAALILAWKFVEDVFIPNREWATLAGLPVWEVARCERALGNALEWQLWPSIHRGVTLRNE